MKIYMKVFVFAFSGDTNENLTTLYDMVTEMSHKLETVSRDLEETKVKLNETEKELTDVTYELRKNKRQLNATVKKVNTGETEEYCIFTTRIRFLRESNVFQSSVFSGIPM